MLLRILTFFKWVYGNPLTFLVGIRRIPAYHVDYTTVSVCVCTVGISHLTSFISPAHIHNTFFCIYFEAFLSPYSAHHLEHTESTIYKYYSSKYWGRNDCLKVTYYAKFAFICCFNINVYWQCVYTTTL